MGAAAGRWGSVRWMFAKWSSCGERDVGRMQCNFVDIQRLMLMALKVDALRSKQ